MPKPLSERIVEAARPPIVWRQEDEAPDYFVHVLLDDLVKAHAWVPRELKEPFLAGWINDGIHDNPDIEDPIEKIAYDNLLAFAAMDPVVDLESLREPKNS
ncbi:hypothetical protein NXS99_04405 [Corynebacterium sp. HS2168-gen11]|nr:hypothetical protein [Corynebacterium sp. HS2168-gen11]